MKIISQDELESETCVLYQQSLRTIGATYLAAQERLQSFSRKIANRYHGGNFGALLSLTMRIPPTKIGSFQPSLYDPVKWIRNAFSFITFTRTQNITGQPAMSVPLFWNSNNIPIGVQFAGRYGDEATLFRLAARLETARPWAEKRPPIYSTRCSQNTRAAHNESASHRTGLASLRSAHQPVMRIVRRLKCI